MAMVFDQFRQLADWFWDDSKWFPPGVNWTSLPQEDPMWFPGYQDMYYPILYSFVIIIIRTVFEW